MAETDIILRVERDKNFKILSCIGLDDHNISFKAKGILAYMLTRPDRWKFWRRNLVNLSTDGRDSVVSGLRELRKQGYLRTTGRAVGGHFVGQIWTISERPMSDSPAVLTDRTTDKPYDGEPVRRKTRTTTTIENVTTTKDITTKKKDELLEPSASQSVTGDLGTGTVQSSSGRNRASNTTPNTAAPPPKRTPWMTPFLDPWVARFGDPLGTKTQKTLIGKFATYLFPLVQEYGSDRVVRAWKRYLQQRSRVQPAWFAEQFKEWDRVRVSDKTATIAKPGTHLRGRRS